MKVPFSPVKVHFSLLKVRFSHPFLVELRLGIFIFNVIGGNLGLCFRSYSCFRFASVVFGRLSYSLSLSQSHFILCCSLSWPKFNLKRFGFVCCLSSFKVFCAEIVFFCSVVFTVRVVSIWRNLVDVLNSLKCFFAVSKFFKSSASLEYLLCWDNFVWFYPQFSYQLIAQTLFWVVDVDSSSHMIFSCRESHEYCWWNQCWAKWHPC